MTPALEIRRDGNCLWIVPRTLHGDLLTSPEAASLRNELQASTAPRLIVDLSELPYFGSTVLEFLVSLWRRVTKKGGRLVIYRASAVGRDVLTAAQLDRLWPLAEDREQALRLVQESVPPEVETAD